MGPAEEPAAITFAALLRQLRIAAGMTQEDLAAAASLSPRSVSDLERGIHPTARSQTAKLLADALRLTGTVRTQFEAAARGLAQTGQAMPGAAAATRTLPRDTGAFTGREPELRQLVGAAIGAARVGGMVGVHAIGGMAGIGKTTFAVHAAHRLAPEFPDGQVFLPLHAHTPGQRPVDPADALASLLLTAGIAASQIPPGLDERTRLWRDHLAGKRVLLVLDDAAGHEQVRPMLPGTPGSIVLVTSRRRLTALEDAQAISLDTLPADEAARLLVRLAARPGLEPADPAVRDIARLCGYLPLAIGMLARQLHHHPTWRAGDLAADLASARDRLGLMQAENLSVSAAFDLSYADLGAQQQQLFRRLGLYPGTDIDHHAAAALDGTDPASARRRLDDLYDHNLLTEPARGRYRLHDLMREHAHTLAAADPVTQRQAALGRLLDYYVRTTRAADRQLAADAAESVARPAGQQRLAAEGPRLASREDAMAWLERERLNLNAAIGHAASHGRPADVTALAAAMHTFLRFAGHWDQAAMQHRAALDCAVGLADRAAEAGALAGLGSIAIATRDYQEAVARLTEAVGLYRELGDLPGEASALSDLSGVLYLTSDNAAAAAGMARALELYSELGDRPGEALVLSRLGSLNLATGEYPAAAASLARALDLYRELGDRLGEADALNELGAVQQATGAYLPAAAHLRQALELYRRLGYRVGEANVLIDLGAAQVATGAHAAAIADLSRALELHERLGDRLGMANATHQLGAAQHASGGYRQAAASQEQALELYRDLGDRAGEAETLIALGNVALALNDPAAARPSYELARSIAADIASPLLQARALEGEGRCHRQDGRLAEGRAALGQAVQIYQRIGSAEADRAARELGAEGQLA
jgi:tetratricopeptide (TPR) repeat protein/transcriptional regulator with XRE-family HTH domain